MNISSIQSTALANVSLPSKVGFAMLNKAMESSESEGEGLINMMDRSMELSVNPNVGSNFDMMV